MNTEWIKSALTVAAAVTLISGFSVRIYADEQKLNDHEQQLNVQTEILQELKDAALAKTAATKAKQAQCKKLVSEGKITASDCDTGEHD